MAKHRSGHVLATCGSIVDELAAGALGDQRLDERRNRVVAILEQHPDRGFPDACADDAESEALYRFLRNPRVSQEAVLAPHLDATRARCTAVGEVLVVHDTTDMVFTGTAPRRGLTRLGPHRQGFWVHASLAVSADGERAPLGVLALQSYARDAARPPRASHRTRVGDPTKERRRWLEGVARVRPHLGPTTTAIHVMDREADSYEILAALIAHRDRFIVRMAYDRRIVPTTETGTRVTDALAQATVVCQREVPLSARRNPPPGRTLYARQRHPARTGRVATLQVATHGVQLRRPPYIKAPTPARLPVHLVWVREIAAPIGTEPVDWRLVTTERIDTVDDVLRIVDAYRARWLIEEYFKALTTGCAYERRQLESLQTLQVALALLAPIAWRLLLLRHLARHQPETPATAVLTSRQLGLLRARPGGTRVPSPATVTDALLAIARLGGHLRHNGPPGWIVLARGFQKLQDMELGWIAAAEARSICDQS